jgi:hypothetical protein
MRHTVRGIIVGAVTAVVAVPFVAIAQEPPPAPEPAEAPEEAPEEAPTDLAFDDEIASLDAEERSDGIDVAETERPEGSGPPWYDGDEPFVGPGPPPWAPAHGYRAELGERPGGGPPFEPPGPPPWAGRDDAEDGGDVDDGTGPPWWSGDAHDGEGPPPWAGRGGPRGRAGADG